MITLLSVLGLALAQSADPEPFPLDFPVPSSGQEAPGAQPAPAPPVEKRSYDPVYVAPLHSDDPGLLAEAGRLSALLIPYLEPRYVVTNVDQVPPWPDYSARIYMESCPPNQYSGCTLVCGDKAGVKYSVGGVLTRAYNGVNVDLVFIDNQSSREVLTFGVALNGSNDQSLLSAVDTILAKIVAGAFAQIDLRIIDTDPAEREKLESAKRDILAASLAELERAAGAIERQDTEVSHETLTKEQIARMEQQEQAKPWEQVGMSPNEYRRYRNSRKPLERWRELQRGRMGQLVGRVGIGGGLGPFGQEMDGRYTYDDTLTVAEIAQFQYISQDTHFDVDLELGFGILPFLDITGMFGYKNGSFRYTLNQERVGEPAFVKEPVQVGLGSWQAGVRASIVPLVQSSVRPAAHFGVAYWQGTTWQKHIGGIDALVEMKEMSMVFMQAGPGVEVTMGPLVNLFARGFVDVPLSDTKVEAISEGTPGSLQLPANPDEFQYGSLGFTIQAGLVGRLTLIGGRKKKSGSSIQFEEEDI